jgi:hypothetical protein
MAFISTVRVRTCSEHVYKGSGIARIARTRNRTVGPVQVNSRTRTLNQRSVRVGSGSDRGSEPNISITTKEKLIMLFGEDVERVGVGQCVCGANSRAYDHVRVSPLSPALVVCPSVGPAVEVSYLSSGAN